MIYYTIKTLCKVNMFRKKKTADRLHENSKQNGIPCIIKKVLKELCKSL